MSILLAALAASLTVGPTAPASPADPAPRSVAPPPVVVPPADTATVVLLHGLGRSEWSMRRMAGRLREAGYRVVNLGYPSTDHTIGTLADTMAAELARCCAEADTVHFVTHSLGGILVRVWAARAEPENLGRVVMLSPPNQGSDVADRIPDRLLRLVMGPASVQLGTDSADLPVHLPPVDFELGIIAGDASINPLYSWWLPGEDDGVVAVESTWVEGADDFLVLPYTHTFIMYRGRVIEEVLSFLRTGQFTEAMGS